MYFKSVNTREKANNRVKIKQYQNPNNHFLIENIFEQDDIEILKKFPLEKYGKRNRFFINDYFVYQNPQFLKLVRLLNDYDWWSEKLHIDIGKHFWLRMELIEDKYSNIRHLEMSKIAHNIYNQMFINISNKDNKNLLIDINNKKISCKENSGFCIMENKEDSNLFGVIPEKNESIGRVLVVEYMKYEDPSSKMENNFRYEFYSNFRNRPKPFEPEKWDKLDLVDKIFQYDKYIEWCGGLYEIDKNKYTEFESHRRNNFVVPFDNVDVLNPGNEDNLYKNLKSYILMSRRWLDNGSVTGLKTRGTDTNWPEKRFKKEMNNFKNLVIDNIGELILMGSGRWLMGGIVLSFVDNGTDEEKLIALCLTVAMVINRVNFKASATFAPRGVIDIYSAQNFVIVEEQEFLKNKILPLIKKKDFESFVEEFVDIIFSADAPLSEWDSSAHGPYNRLDMPWKLKRHQLLPTLAYLWNKEETSNFKKIILRVLNRNLP